MKKILYLLLVVISAFVFSSLTYPTTIKKNLKSNDSTQVTMNLNVTAKNIGPYKLETNETFIEALKSTIEVNNLKIGILKSLEKKSPEIKKEILPTSKEVILEKYGYTKEIIVKRIRADTLIKWISTSILMILSLWILWLIRNSKVEWKPLLIKGFFITILLIICQFYLYYWLSYIFNSDYTNIISLIKILT